MTVISELCDPQDGHATTVAAWLMATLTTSALMVALVQTASTIPSLMFGLIAGAIADIVDRRKVVLSTQILLLAATVVLGVATLAGLIGPVSLLVLTFLIMWIRFSYPRFREDQLQRFAWKVLIPLALFNIMVTAVLKVVF